MVEPGTTVCGIPGIVQGQREQSQQDLNTFKTFTCRSDIQIICLILSNVIYNTGNKIIIILFVNVVK